MDKNNLELFKQAVSEGLSQKLDSVVDSCTEEIVCSKRHELAMRTIVRGKVDNKRTLSPKMRRIIAILVAAALILTSCGIIFRNEIREMFEDICDFFVAITYTEKDSDGKVIEDVYELGYLPDGYSPKEEVIAPLCTQFKYVNKNGDYIWFEQKIIDGTDFYLDSESGYTQISNIRDYEVYYRYTDQRHVYIWNDGKYSMFIRSNLELSTSEIVLMLEGLILK